MEQKEGVRWRGPVSEQKAAANERFCTVMVCLIFRIHSLILNKVNKGRGESKKSNLVLNTAGLIITEAGVISQRRDLRNKRSDIGDSDFHSGFQCCL